MKIPARKWIAIDERDGEALLPTLSNTREAAIAQANIIGTGDFGLRFHVTEVLIFAIHESSKTKLLSQEL